MGERSGVGVVELALLEVLDSLDARAGRLMWPVSRCWLR